MEVILDEVDQQPHAKEGLRQVSRVARNPDYDQELDKELVVAHHLGDLQVLEGEKQEEGTAADL